MSQQADNYIKSINNRLQRLRNKGYKELADESIQALKNNGYETRFDKYGNEVLSRGKSNINQYTQSVPEERQYNKNEVYTIKEAKRETEIRQQKANQITDIKSDMFSDVSTWYNIASMLAELWNNYLDENPNHKSDYISIKEAMEKISERGLDLEGYRQLARQSLNNMISYESRFKQLYDDLDW